MRKLLSHLVLLTCVAFGGSLALTVTPAHADGLPAAPVVTGIVNGGRYQQGQLKSATVDFSAYPAGDYDAYVNCDGSDYDASVSVPDSSVGTLDFGENGLSDSEGYGDDDCTLDFMDDAGTYFVQWRFTILPAAPQIDRVAVTNQKFYPRVRDGYRDNTSFGVYTRKPMTNLRADVLNARGESIRTLNSSLISLNTYSGTLTWDGRTRTGTTAAVGSYAIVIEASDGASISSRTVHVTIAHAMRAFFVKKRHPASWGTPATTTGCGIDENWDTSTGQVLMTCGGGQYATLSDAIGFPGNATHRAAHIGWWYSNADECCDGRFQRKVAWHKHSVTITAKISGTRQVVVSAFFVTYRIRRMA